MKKWLFLTYFSHFLVTKEKTQKSFGTFLTHINARILLTQVTFLALPILQKLRIYHMVSLWCDFWC